MSSAWATYVATNLKLERQTEFTKDEVKLIAAIKKRLAQIGAEGDWDKLHKELQLMVVKGYLDRKDTVGDASEVTRDIVAWRTKNNVDSFLDVRLDGEDKFQDAWKSYIAGEDEWGHFINYECIQDINIKALQQLDEDALIMCRAKHIEALNYLKYRSSMRIGHRICKVISIFDTKGLVIGTHFTAKVRKLIFPIIKISSDYYPDTLWSMFIVNTPMVFRVVWTAISPAIDPVVKTKIRMPGSQNAHLKSMQKTGIPLSSIPKRVGGTCECVNIKDLINEIHEERKQQPDSPHILTGHHFNRLTKYKSSRLSGTSEPESEYMEDDDDSPVFDDDNVIISGYLNKRGSVNSLYKTRYFILTPHGLYYFIGKPKKESHVLRGKIDLHLITNATVVSKEAQTFNLHTPSRVYQLQVESKKGEDAFDATEWVKAVMKASENDRCTLETETSIVIPNTNHDDHIKSGFLLKKGLFNQSWRKRYFVLTASRLYYYSDKPGKPNSKLKGSIDLHIVQSTSEHIKGNHDGKFDVLTPVRVYRLRSIHDGEMEGWIEAINSAAENERDVKESAQASSLAEGVEDEDDIAMTGLSFLTEFTLEQLKEVFSVATFGSLMEQIVAAAEDMVRIAAEYNLLSADLSVSMEENLEMVRRRVRYMFRLSLEKEKRRNSSLPNGLQGANTQLAALKE